MIDSDKNKTDDLLLEAGKQKENEKIKIFHDTLMASTKIKAQVYKAIVEKPITMAEIELLPANPKHHTYSTSFRQWAEAGLVAKDSKGRIYCSIPGTPSNQAVIEQGTFIDFQIAPRRIVNRNIKQQLFAKDETLLNNTLDSRKEKYFPNRKDFESAYKMLSPIVLEAKSLLIRF